MFRVCACHLHAPVNFDVIKRSRGTKTDSRLFFGRSIEAAKCNDALSEALERYGRPGIFNTDQGSRFTRLEFTSVLKDSGVAISTDGRGRCMDNIFIERLWRSLKYEAVYIHEL